MHEGLFFRLSLLFLGHVYSFTIITCCLTYIFLQFFQVLTTNAIQVIIDALGDPTTRLLGLTILISLVDKRSDDVAQHDDVIIKAITADDMAATQGCVIIGKMSHLSEVRKHHRNDN